jgi:hypothetical protein
MQLGPEAFASPDVLASTIVHETTHANQAAARRARDPGLTDWPSDNNSVNYDEAGAYQSEVFAAGNTGLASNPSEYQLAESRRAGHYAQLPARMQTQFGEGKYPP